ncbi:16S rRNA (uracil(1498)-N(3))-methyltransferase [Ureaplasma canigenitalium]|uniref:16S rRNA (uracil(1498)-N(3))-methyltransferase n=1 Tax=Ureaplasma canigenitalium TaxID=42092 RepID=UPI0004E21C33|nr:16S rRNA (uracil(1498)-N(3))-methyltransferase [Ureaplasma canigenitalium]
MRQYFALKIKDGKVFLKDEDKHHIVTVLRCQIGDQFIVVNQGVKYLCRVTAIAPLFINVEKTITDQNEINYHIDVFSSFIKPSHFEYMVMKSAEFGVKNFYPISFRYTVKDPRIKHERILKIIDGAAKQSNNIEIMHFHNQMSFSLMLEMLTTYDLVVFSYEKEEKYLLNKINDEIKKANRIALIIGPEGGFHPDEYLLLKKLKNVKTTKLTNTILRTETALFYLISNIIDRKL